MTTFGIIALCVGCSSASFCIGTIVMGVLCMEKISDLVVENETMRETILGAESV